MNISRIVKQPSEWNFGRAKSVNSLTACCEEWFEQLWDLCALLLSSSSLRYIKLTQCQNYSFNLFWLKKEIFSGSGELKVCKWDESRNHTAVAVRRFFAAFSLIMPCFCKTMSKKKILIKWDQGKVLFLGTPSYGGRFSDASRRMRRALKAAERQKCDATEIDPSDALCNQQAISGRLLQKAISLASIVLHRSLFLFLFLITCL